MDQEIIRSYGGEVNGLVMQLRGAGTQRKVMNNRLNSAETELKVHKDNIKNSLRDSTLTGVALKIKESPTFQLIDAGSNDVVNVSWKGAEELGDLINQYITGLTKDDSSTESLNAYYTAVAAALVTQKAAWIVLYGLMDDPLLDSNRYDSYYRRLFRAVMMYSNIEVTTALRTIFADESEVQHYANLLDQSDIADSAMSRSTADSITNSIVNSESLDFDTQDGRDVIRKQLVERVFPVSESLRLLGEMDLLEGKTSLLPDELDCHSVTSHAGIQAIKEDIANSLNPAVDLDSPTGIANTTLLADRVANPSLAADIINQLAALGTVNDPMVNHLNEVTSLLSTVDPSLNSSLLDQLLDRLFQDMSSTHVPLITRSQVATLLRDCIDLKLSNSDRVATVDDVWLNLVPTQYRDNRATLTSLVELRCFGVYYAPLFNGTQTTLTAGNSRILDILEVMRPASERTRSNPFYLNLLSALIQPLSTAQAIQTDVSDMLTLNPLSDLFQLKHARLITNLDALPADSTANQIRETCHLLVGDVLGSQYLDGLRREVSEADVANAAIQAERFDLLVDHTMGTTTWSDAKAQLQVLFTALPTLPPKYATQYMAIASRVTYLLNSLDDIALKDEVYLGMIIGELVYWFDFVSSSLLRFEVETGVNVLVTTGHSLSDRQGVISSFHSLFPQLVLDAPSLSALSSDADVLYSDLRSTPNNSKTVLYRIIPGLKDDLDAIFAEFNRLLGVVNVNSLAPDALDNAQNAVASVVIQYLDNRTALTQKITTAVHNNVTKARVFSNTGNSFTFMETPPNPPSNMAYYNDKYALFGAGAKFLGKLDRMSNNNIIYLQSLNRITAKFLAPVQKVVCQIYDMRNTLGLNTARQTILKYSSIADQKIAQVLCLFDFVHDMIKIINGFVDSFFRGISQVIASLNATIQQIISALQSIFKTISQLANISIGAQCSCLSFNFRSGLNRNFLDDLSDWLGSLNLNIPDPFASLHGPFINPKLGCPQSLIPTLKGGVNLGSSSAISGIFNVSTSVFPT